MTIIADRISYRRLHPIHAFVLAAAVPLFLGALLSDIAYASSYQIQWSNFASWLIAGGLVFLACALLWAVVDLIRHESPGGWPLIYMLLVLASWVLGFTNALIHARDAWAVMPTGLILSLIVTVLAGTATWIGFSSFAARGDP